MYIYKIKTIIYIYIYILYLIFIGVWLCLCTPLSASCYTQMVVADSEADLQEWLIEWKEIFGGSGRGVENGMEGWGSGDSWWRWQ